MTDDAPSPAAQQLPWDLHPALTEEHLVAAARLLAQGRRDAIMLADHWAGDDAWSIGCRAYAFSKHQLSRAAASGRYPWLDVLDETHHFVFLIEGVPVRFFRGEAEEPSKRTLRQQESEAEQLALALGARDAEGLKFRFAVETEADGVVKRIVFLALRGEGGQVACFWPVPLGDDAGAVAEQHRRRNSNALLPLPLSQGAVATRTPASRQRTTSLEASAHGIRTSVNTR